MTSTPRVTHRIVWSVVFSLLNFAFFMTLLALIVTVVPVGILVEEPHEVARTALQFHAALGNPGPEALFVVLGWGVVAVLAVPWALLVRGAWRAAVEQYRDLFGAERELEGVIERLEVRGTGSRRRFEVHVQGEGFLVPPTVFASLRAGQQVRLRSTKFNNLVKELAEVDPGTP
jgi:hypothetical protein